MKIKLLILLIIVQSSFSLYASAQDLPINSRFKGGSEGFYRFMTENLKYPVESVNSKTIGYSITEITITPEGKIKEISIINPLDESIDNEIKAALEKTKNKWIRSKTITTDQTFYVQVVYRMDHLAGLDPGGDYPVRDVYNFLEPVYIAEAVRKKIDLPEANDSIRAKISKSLKENKNEDALRYTDELIRRNPFVAEMYQLRILVNRKLKNNELIAKDAQRMENFIPGVSLNDFLAAVSQVSAKKDSIANIRSSKDAVYGIGVKQDTTVQMPEFPGGLNELMKFIQNNLEYPSSASREGIQGKVYVRFIVDKNGRVKAPVILKSVHPLLDEEAKRIVNLMPLWKPGRKNGRAINVYYTLPIQFAMRKEINLDQKIRMGI
jgi:TonB family protein